MPEIDWSKHTLIEKDFHVHISHFLLPLKVHVLAVAILNYHISIQAVVSQRGACPRRLQLHETRMLFIPNSRKTGSVTWVAWAGYHLGGAQSALNSTVWKALLLQPLAFLCFSANSHFDNLDFLHWAATPQPWELCHGEYEHCSVRLPPTVPTFIAIREVLEMPNAPE